MRLEGELFSGTRLNGNFFGHRYGLLELVKKGVSQTGSLYIGSLISFGMLKVKVTATFLHLLIGQKSLWKP